MFLRHLVFDSLCCRVAGRLAGARLATRDVVSVAAAVTLLGASVLVARSGHFVELSSSLS